MAAILRTTRRVTERGKPAHFLTPPPSGPPPAEPESPRYPAQVQAMPDPEPIFEVIEPEQKKPRDPRGGWKIPPPPVPLSGHALAMWQRVAVEADKRGILSPLTAESYAVACQTWGRLQKAICAMDRLADRDPVTHAVITQTPTGRHQINLLHQEITTLTKLFQSQCLDCALSVRGISIIRTADLAAKQITPTLPPGRSMTDEELLDAIAKIDPTVEIYDG